MLKKMRCISKEQRNENMATCSIRSDYLKLFFQIIVFRINIDMR